MIMNKSSGTIYHASPEGVSIMDDTNNKSSGTIYHASPEGVSIMEDTNNKSSGTSSHASPRKESITMYQPKDGIITQAPKG